MNPVSGRDIEGDKLARNRISALGLCLYDLPNAQRDARAYRIFTQELAKAVLLVVELLQCLVTGFGGGAHVRGPAEVSAPVASVAGTGAVR